MGLIPGLGQSPGEGNGNPLWYYCLENSKDRGAWCATVHGIAKAAHDLATKHLVVYCWSFPGGSDGKELPAVPEAACSAGDVG